MSADRDACSDAGEPMTDAVVAHSPARSRRSSTSSDNGRTDSSDSSHESARSNSHGQSISRRHIHETAKDASSSIADFSERIMKAELGARGDFEEWLCAVVTLPPPARESAHQKSVSVEPQRHHQKQRQRPQVSHEQQISMLFEAVARRMLTCSDQIMLHAQILKEAELIDRDVAVSKHLLTYGLLQYVKKAILWHYSRGEIKLHSRTHRNIQRNVCLVRVLCEVWAYHDFISTTAATFLIEFSADPELSASCLSPLFDGGSSAFLRRAWSSSQNTQEYLLLTSTKLAWVKLNEQLGNMHNVLSDTVGLHTMQSNLPQARRRQQQQHEEEEEQEEPCEVQQLATGETERPMSAEAILVEVFSKVYEECLSGAYEELRDSTRLSLLLLASYLDFRTMYESFFRISFWNKLSCHRDEERIFKALVRIGLRVLVILCGRFLRDRDGNARTSTSARSSRRTALRDNHTVPERMQTEPERAGPAGSGVVDSAGTWTGTSRSTYSAREQDYRRQSLALALILDKFSLLLGIPSLDHELRAMVATYLEQITDLLPSDVAARLHTFRHRDEVQFYA
ncbi:hypothetical protein FVE85_4165 [Porphyridium purpureum]|uniref:Uncharacterized protein n=1 Tax=Porphyridium purpureum TaxID=35688 RepID=A0A5J4YTD5_PORPP|nr:hypothetical protein FVE85_4165 [Porphyridium purpureum]|eukprot:POR6652..scf229_5